MIMMGESIRQIWVNVFSASTSLGLPTGMDSLPSDLLFDPTKADFGKFPDFISAPVYDLLYFLTGQFARVIRESLSSRLAQNSMLRIYIFSKMLKMFLF